MENTKISPLAYIHPEAIIGENCEIGPFCYIDRGVEIGDDNKLMNSVTLLYGTRMGKGNTLFPGAVIGAVPQDLKFRGEDTTAEVGDYNTIRENVTINRGTAAKGRTIVGSKNLLMEGVHIAHDVLLGNGCILGNSTKLAGEVEVDDFAILSAAVLVHQFCHIGSYVMVSGGSKTAQDVPPFIMAARDPLVYCGLNVVGLRRRQFDPVLVENIHQAYNIIYREGGLLKERLERVRQNIPMSPEIEYIINFISQSKRGFIS